MSDNYRRHCAIKNALWRLCQQAKCPMRTIHQGTYRDWSRFRSGPIRLEYCLNEGLLWADSTSADMSLPYSAQTVGFQQTSFGRVVKSQSKKEAVFRKRQP